MKNTSKLIGILSALIVVILTVFLVTKFNSHESRVLAQVVARLRRSRNHLQAQVKLLRRIRKIQTRM